MKTIDLAYIVDDDEILVFLTKKLMEKNPHFQASQAFYNGQDAIDCLKSVVSQGAPLPDMIFLDLNMPVMDGWQFLDEFVQLPIQKEIPVFLVTSSIDPSDIEKAKRYGVVKDYIMKPITRDILTNILGGRGNL